MLQLRAAATLKPAPELPAALADLPRWDPAAAVRSRSFAPNLPYMFHSHLLMHEDDGMMGQFVVVAPGEEAGTPPPGTRHPRHG